LLWWCCCCGWSRRWLPAHRFSGQSCSCELSDVFGSRLLFERLWTLFGMTSPLET
jgi:hypothetical protein